MADSIERPKSWVSNPRPAWLYYAARGHISKLYMYIYIYIYIYCKNFAIFRQLGTLYNFLGAFTKLRKATVSFVMSVLLLKHGKTGFMNCIVSVVYGRQRVTRVTEMCHCNK